MTRSLKIFPNSSFSIEILKPREEFLLTEMKWNWLESTLEFRMMDWSNEFKRRKFFFCVCGSVQFYIEQLLAAGSTYYNECVHLMSLSFKDGLFIASDFVESRFHFHHLIWIRGQYMTVANRENRCLSVETVWIGTCSINIYSTCVIENQTPKVSINGCLLQLHLQRAI